MSGPPYSASLEWLCPHVAIARVHPGPGGRLGDPYLWCVTVERVGTTARLRGALGAPPVGSTGPLLAALYRAGLRRRVVERRNVAHPRTSVRDIPPPRPTPDRGPEP